MNEELLSALLRLLIEKKACILFFPDSGLGVSIISGEIVGIKGEPDPRILEGELSALVPEKILLRAKKTAEVSGASLFNVLEELGVLPEDLSRLLLRIGAQKIEEALSSQPEKVPFLLRAGENVAPKNESLSNTIPLFQPLIRALSRWDPRTLLKDLPRWGERDFSPEEESFAKLPKAVQDFLKEGARVTSLKEYLRKATIPPREALAYVVVAVKLGWFPERQKREASSPTKAKDSQSAPSPKDEPSLPPEVVAPSPQTPTPPPPKPPSSPPFYQTPPPADVYARLGIPPGTAGQGVTQAYSRRLIEVRKALEQNPGSSLLQSWQEALLRAYRILTHPQAYQLYEGLAAQGVPESERDQRIFKEMGERAWQRGLKEFRGGDRYQGIKLVQEALSWNPRLPYGWALLALHAVWGGEEEIPEALNLLEKALSLAKEDPYLHYLYGIMAYTMGKDEGFSRVRDFFARNPDRTPPAWKDFLTQEVGR